MDLTMTGNSSFITETVLDLYCGVGGATAGYQRLGWKVVGVDINPQPDYCGDEFIQADAIEFGKEFGHLFKFVHASPPCQYNSTLTKGTNKGKMYPDLIPATRSMLENLDRPWVIENVISADIERDIVLCGEMFSLSVLRHRAFEFSAGCRIIQPHHKAHRGRVAGYRHGTWYPGPYYAVYGEGGGKGTIEEWQGAMGIDWTDNRKSIAEAIPPAYTECIGKMMKRTLEFWD